MSTNHVIIVAKTMANTLLFIMEKNDTFWKACANMGRVKVVLISRMFEINEIENVSYLGFQVEVIFIFLNNN